MKSNFKDVKNLLLYLQSLGLPVLLEKLQSLRSGPEVYENYRKTLDKYREKVPEFCHYTDENFMRICRIILGPFTQYTMETYFEIISERMKIKRITMTTEIFYNHIKKIP